MLVIFLFVLEVNLIENKSLKTSNLLSTNDTFKRNLSEVWQTELRYETFEELPPETVVGDLASDLKKAKLNYASIMNYNFQSNNFIIVSQKVQRKNPATLFVVNSTSGLLKVARKIDREELCLDNSAEHDSCLVQLDVLNSVESGGWPCFREIIKITVDILDINDHKPFFRHIGKVFQAPFSELAPVGSGSALPLAEDKDSVRFGIQNYFIEDIFEAQNGSSHFLDYGSSRNFNTNDSTTSDGGLFRLDIQKLKENGAILGVVLRIKVPLDRESKDIHWLRLVAIDGGNPSLRAQLLVRVVVEDFNDNAPKFEKPIYEFEANQDSIGEFALGKVRAGDADTGPNAEIRYFVDSCQVVSSVIWHQPHVAEPSDLECAYIFVVDEVTGEIFSRKQASIMEETVVYKLIVRAEDRGEHSLSDRATSFIRIVSPGRGSFNRDSNKARTMEDHDRPHFRSLTRTGGISDVTAKLDIFKFELNSFDFFSERFSFQVLENQPQSTFVGLLAVATLKTGELLHDGRNDTTSGFVEYRLKGNTMLRETFIIEPQTGVLLTATELDREDKEMYSFSVEVIYVILGRITVLDSTEVSVQVLDLNDNVPILTLMEQFSGSFATFSTPNVQPFNAELNVYDEVKTSFVVLLPQFLPAGIVLFSVHTSDLDLGQNADVGVDILSTEAMLLYDFENGEIELESQYNCIHHEPHSLIVEACDRGRPKLCSSLKLLLKCPRDNRNSTENWSFARAKSIFEGANKLNLLAVGALTATLTFSIVLACFFIVGYLKNLTMRSTSLGMDKPVWSIKREGFVRPEVDFLRSPQIWGHDNLENCLLHTTDV